MEVSAGGGGVTKAAAEDVAGNKATVPEAVVKTKRTKTMRVKQGYIDLLLERYPWRPFPGDPEEVAKLPDPVEREKFRMLLAPVTALIKAGRDKDEAIIKQYLAKGYAEEEFEVSGDDEEEVKEDMPADAKGEVIHARM